MTYENDSITAVVKPGFLYGDGSYEESSATPGLTKLEYFASMAMWGYITAGSNGMPSYEHIAEHAISAAKALINELNKTV